MTVYSEYDLEMSLTTILCAAKFWGNGHNIHYDINLEGTLGVKKNLISKKKKFGKGGA